MKNKICQNRIIYLDFIRVVAIFFVIFNHTSEIGFSLFTAQPIHSIRFYVYLALSIVSKVAVPLFFAISGALLLGEESDEIVKLWKNRVLKMIVILIIFSIVNYVNYCLITGKEIRIDKLFLSMYSGPSMVNGHLWYLYAYIVFLICLPLLQALVRNLENKYFYYMISIVLIIKVLYVIEYIFASGDLQISEMFLDNMWVLTDIVIYPCVGYFLHCRVDPDDLREKLLVLWMVNLLGIACSCYMVAYLGQVEGTLNELNTDEFMCNFVLLNCLSIFSTAKYVFSRVELPNLLNKIIVSLGKATFGIYLMHQLVKCYFNHYEIVPQISVYGVDSMVAVILYCFGVLMITYGITWVLWKVPVVRKLIGG